MSLTKTTCPECGAGLKSAAGFNPGQQVRCPKCSAAFAVPAAPAFEAVEDDADEPAPKKKGPLPKAGRVVDDDDDRPRKKRRPRDDDGDDDDDDDDRPRKKGKKKKGGYKNSPLRYAVLAILLVIMGVLAFMLYQKRMKEKEDANAPAPAANTDDTAPEFRPAPRPGPPRAGPGAPGDAVVGVGGGGNDFQPPAGGGPDQNTVRRAANDVKQIMLAFHNHHDVTRALPQAAIAGPDGKALLSWRVAILPYIEQDNLYKQFKLNEPWDSPANKKLLQYMPRTYQGTLPATGDGKTAFKVFVGGGAAFDLKRVRKMQDIADGTSNTFALVESGPPVEWTKPEDVPFDGKTAPRLVPPTGGDLLLVGMMDGTYRRISLSRNPPDVIFKGITAGGGEIVQFE